MIAFLARRTLWFFATLLAVASVSFVLMRSARGGPFDAERRLDPAIERNLRARYHLDWPAWKQFLGYVGPLNLDERRARVLGGDGTRVLGGVLAGDFGPSLRYRDQSVGDLLGESLDLLASARSLLGAVAIGLGGRRLCGAPGSLLDRAVRAASSALLALPSFVVASALVLLFVLALPLFPVAGFGTWRHRPPRDRWGPIAAHVARLARTGMLDTLPGLRRRARKACRARRDLRTRRPARSCPSPPTSGGGRSSTGSLVVERIFAIPRGLALREQRAEPRLHARDGRYARLLRARLRAERPRRRRHRMLDPRVAREVADAPSCPSSSSPPSSSGAVAPPPAALAVGDGAARRPPPSRPARPSAAGLARRRRSPRSTRGSALRVDSATWRRLPGSARTRKGATSSRVVWGGTRILAALAATRLFAIGATYGAVAGLLGGRADDVMMRAVDALQSLPFVSS